MSLHTQSEKSVHKAVFEKSSKSSGQVPKKSRMKPNLAKRKKKFSSRLNMWIRRIHLFSGLFMLPWVLLCALHLAMRRWLLCVLYGLL